MNSHGVIGGVAVNKINDLGDCARLDCPISLNPSMWSPVCFAQFFAQSHSPSAWVVPPVGLRA